MIYVFDTSSIRALQHFYPSIFKTIWDGLDDLVKQGELISTREVYNELERQAVSADVLRWAKSNKALFTIPNAAELQFVAEILRIKKFQALIGEQQRLKGMRSICHCLCQSETRHGGNRRAIQIKWRENPQCLSALQSCYSLCRSGRVYATAGLEVLK